MFNTIVGAGAVGAGAASRYGSGSGSDKKDAAPCGSGSATLIESKELEAKALLPFPHIR
jgi:hypothetical protein